MKVAFGFKAHSGWAALVVLGGSSAEPRIVDRRRIELVEEGEEWAKQPYHAAEELSPPRAEELIDRSLRSARRNAVREMRAAVRRSQEQGDVVAACGVLMGEPMPDWSVAEILAVHFRMHKAEGVMFREALAHAATACSLKLVPVLEKELADHAERALAASKSGIAARIAALGKSAGRPWAKDQKDAALAAMIALHGRA